MVKGHSWAGPGSPEEDSPTLDTVDLGGLLAIWLRDLQAQSAMLPCSSQ